ncbi:Rieske (2Fe-2S) protein [Rhodococcus sp. DMU1]|uniref:Rieske (2Fe-2S) protein n=1 Tax=Rhodococcus sp. DMU1 TaxID=2722825 RepID=UPI00143E3685|nr:Rieske (2Fe-2S) protein [Rhodococcus sp. DMU1]QIX52631.1 Rieske (2Fe-2S) protein [Rhodococcus sp. DMU1]
MASDHPVEYDVGHVEELFSRGRAVVPVGPDELPVLVVKTRRGLFAVTNRCPHRGASLDDAEVSRSTITCALHEYRFDLRSGRVTGGWGTRPTCDPLVVHRVRLADGRLVVALARSRADSPRA